ncbi:unnamed protein product [Choristocarpus tenellus]
MGVTEELCQVKRKDLTEQMVTGVALDSTHYGPKMVKSIFCMTDFIEQMTWSIVHCKTCFGVKGPRCLVDKWTLLMSTPGRIYFFLLCIFLTSVYSLHSRF